MSEFNVCLLSFMFVNGVKHEHDAQAHCSLTEAVNAVVFASLDELYNQTLHPQTSYSTLKAAV